MFGTASYLYVNYSIRYHYISVPGGWSDWSEWDACSEDCGTGIQGRTRACDTPEPAHGGADCDGLDTETQACNVDPCPGKITRRRLAL